MNTKTRFFKSISIFTILLFMNACTIHTLKEVPKEKINDAKEENILLIHKDDLIFGIMQPQISNGTLSGIAYLYTAPSKKKDFKEFHLYLMPTYKQEIESGKMLSIPISDISKLEIYKISPGRILLGTILAVVGFYIIVFILVSINGVDLGWGGDMNVSFEGTE